MREMKESGFGWLRDIPLDWDILKTKDGFIRKKAKALQNDPVVLSLARSGVKVRDISTNEGQLAASYYEYNPVTIDDMLLNPMDLQSGANCSISKVDGVISPAYINLRYKKGFNPTFYDYYFKYQYWSYAFFSYGKGVSFDNRWTLNEDTLMNLPLLVPSKKEQDRIAAYLDKQCKKIDEIMADIQSQIDTLDDYKKSIISEAVRKGLNKKAKYKGTLVPWAKEIPSHWKVMPNKYIMKKVKIICSVHKDEPIISLSMNGVIVRDLEAGGKMPTSFDGYQYVYPGNILMCLFDYDVTPRCIGYINDYGVTSPAYSQFKMKSGNNARYYYYYYLMIDNTKELLHLAKNLRHSFTEDELSKIKQIVPPIEEQKAIADYLDEKCAEIDSIIAAKKLQLSTLKDYKKSLIYEYITGKKEAPNE